MPQSGLEQAPAAGRPGGPPAAHPGAGEVPATPYAPAWEQVIAKPADGTSPRRRGGWTFALGGALAALLVAATAAGGFALLRDDAPEPRASDRSAPSAETEVTSSTEPTPTDESTSAEPSESSAPTTAPPSARCWDGSSETRLRDCPPPTGQRGLRWVFPQMDETTCSASHRSATRPQIWSCTGYLADGTAIALNYSQWYRVAPGVAHYDRDSYDKQSLGNGLVRWWIISRTGDYKAAFMYADSPWSVTVYAPTEGARDRAIRTFATMRPRAQLLGKG